MGFNPDDIKKGSVVKIRIDAVGGDLDRVVCRYPASFMNEMARQLTLAIEAATGVTGIADSSVELVMMFASGTYMEHVSGNVTYRRLSLIDAVSAPRDFWIKWTRLSEVEGEYNEENILFELGEDVEHKIREREYKYLLSSQNEKYHNAMGRKKVTEWREVIKRAVKRGELVKIESDFELEPETLALEERIADLLGKRIESRNAHQNAEEVQEQPASDEYVRAIEKARLVVEGDLEEQQNGEELPQDENISEYEEEPLTLADDTEDLPALALEIDGGESDDEIEIDIFSEDEPEAEEEFAIEDESEAEEEFAIDDEPEAEEEFAIDDEPEAEEEFVIEDEPEAEEEFAIDDEPEAEEEFAIDDEPEAEEEFVIEDEPEAEEEFAIDDEPEAEEESLIDDEPEAEEEFVIEDEPEAEEENEAVANGGIVERIADIRAEIETKIRLEYEVRARVKAEEELIELRRKIQRLETESELTIANLKTENERLRTEYDRLLEQIESERFAREAEEARRRLEEKQLREQIERQMRAEAEERERLAESARMAIEEQRRLEAENARIARERDEEARAEAERLRREDQERELAEVRRAELERIRREQEEMRERARAAMPEMGDGSIERTSKTVKLLFCKSVDPNITVRIQQLIKATVDYYGKEGVNLRIRATIPDNRTVLLEFVDIPIDEMPLLGNIIKVIGNNGLGVVKAIID